MRSRKLNFVSITFIVKDVVRDSFIRDHGVAAGLVKLHFSDCFVRVSKHAAMSLILLALVSRFSLVGSLLHFTGNIGENLFHN